MLHVDYTTIRDVQRNYKKISEEVNKEDLSFVVMSNNRPQFVIVGLKTFSKLQTPGAANDAGASLLSLIDWAEKKDFDLPADLSEKHDDYLWKTHQEQ
jgi:hypothetical protein